MRYEFGGLIFEGACLRNFTVFQINILNHHYVFVHLVFVVNLRLEFNRTKDSLEVKMLQQHNLFYYGVLTFSRLTNRQPREEFQCLYENLMSDGFRKAAVLKKLLFSLS